MDQTGVISRFVFISSTNRGLGICLIECHAQFQDWRIEGKLTFLAIFLGRVVLIDKAVKYEERHDFVGLMAVNLDSNDSSRLSTARAYRG